MEKLIDVIKNFSGPYKDLSNFAWSPFEYNGKRYCTIEHAFQAAKATNESDHEYIRKSCTPSDAKKRGRSIQCRQDWKDVKNNIMLTFLRIKFRQDKFKKLLLSTEDFYLEEGNYWHDNYWGNCYCGRSGCKKDGINTLGKLLMVVRDEIIKRGK